MCGFAAIYSVSKRQCDVPLLEAMTCAVRHRGPDDYGFAAALPSGNLVWREGPVEPFHLDGVAMGHRRLSIVDLSAAGRQPFFSRNGRYCMVYNGEVYNYKELKKELENAGYTFRTHTDTEVLLAAFEEWGARCFSRFNGMWAVLIWDNRERVLTASRDRFGVKPLYYTCAGGDWVFASEVRPLLLHPGVAAQPADEAVFRFLTQHLQPAAGKTFFEGIHEVEAATVLTFREGKLPDSKPYWNLPGGPWLGEDRLEEAVERVSGLLADAVRLRLRADVRVGTMLSGGLDSTSVIRNMLDLHASLEGADERRTLGNSIQAFHAAYPGTDIDETSRVRELCVKRSITLHEVFPAQEDDLETLYRAVMEHLEMPFRNSVPVVQTLLMRRAKEEGVTVVLNGHGPDEMLAGYGETYRRLAAAGAWLRGDWRSGWAETRAARRWDGRFGSRDAWKALLWSALPATLVRRFARPGLGEALGRAELRRRYPAVHSSLLARQMKGRTPLDRQLHFDFFRNILPRWLQLEDRASMSVSVESRLPFLDYRFVEFCFCLDDPLKIKDGVTKRVLRRSAEGLLPDSIVHETQKFRFSGPDAQWMRGPLRRLIETTLLSGDPLIARYLDLEAMRARLRGFLAGEGSRLSAEWMWTLLNTETWLRLFFGGERKPSIAAEIPGSRQRAIANEVAAG